ncbi:MAG: helix-turn-helix transcriptional regulator [Planctomycetes bacterium]|nr:helix-turn-helix transcriptional regulator [Planctomycetota bacterium]
MKITKQATDDAILRELGERFARIRLEHNLTQAELAEQAGISKRTLERLESGSVAAHLSALIRVCRALDMLDRFDMIVAEPPPSPIAQLKLRGRTRMRASAKKPSGPSAGKWSWGDNK